MELPAPAADAQIAETPAAPHHDENGNQHEDVSQAHDLPDRIGLAQPFRYGVAHHQKCAAENHEPDSPGGLVNSY